MSKFAELDNTALDALFTEKTTAFQTLIATEAPTVAQVEEATALAVEIDEIVAEQGVRETAAAAAAEAFEALKVRKFGAEVVGEPVEETEEVVDEEVEEVEEVVEPPAAEAAAAVKPVAAAPVKKIAARSTRPATPKRTDNVLSIVAAANVEGFVVGQELADIEQISKAVMSKMRGFSPPQGDGTREDIQKFGVAQIRLPFEEEFIVDRQDDAYGVLSHAAKESRLEGESLTASGGWCSPSETMYDLQSDETLEGILSVPEVQIKRGGMRYTVGPQFVDFYAQAGFIQTEGQAIAGTTKPFYEVTCPTFTDVRLDAVGVGIKVPILTNSAWPELVQRFTSGTLIAHEHMINANVISRMVTFAGSARVFTGLGSSVADSLEALELVANQRRQSQRLSLKHTMEVVVPFWVGATYRADLSRRTGQTDSASDEQINAHFAARGLQVSYVYDWQVLNETVEVYPTTYQVLVYPAGTFVKGVSDVINLSAVYDAAGLAVNTYTGLFVEQGLLVAQMQYGADLLTLPICNAGRSGAANFTCA